MSTRRRLVLLAVAAGLGGFVAVLFGFGGCHDGGGFCTGGFTSANLFAYVIGVGVSAVAGLDLGLALVDDRRAAFAGAGLAVVVACTAIYLLEN